MSHIYLRSSAVPFLFLLFPSVIRQISQCPMSGDISQKMTAIFNPLSRVLVAKHCLWRWTLPLPLADATTLFYLQLIHASVTTASKSVALMKSGVTRRISCRNRGQSFRRAFTVSQSVMFSFPNGASGQFSCCSDALDLAPKRANNKKEIPALLSGGRS